jgi:Protein of unknown function (DUF4232)
MIMRRFLTRAAAIGAAILAALSLGAYALASTSTSTRPAPATPAKAAATVAGCTAAALGVWAAESQSNGAAGTIYYPLQFTNISSHTCTLRGYPGVSALAQQGTQLGNSAAWGGIGSIPVRTITLAPGQTGHSVLAYGDAQVGSTTQTAYAARLRIYPPNQSTPTYAFWSLKGITVTGVTYLRVSPVEAGLGLIGNV